jgi:hypothetical protein
MAEIRTLVTPSKLYRYRSLGDDRRLEQEMRALEEGYLWCSPFGEMNDPMEGLYEADHTFTDHPRYEEIRDGIYHGKAHIGICSLSETGTNELMWAHYADQFRGICVEYDLTALLGNLPDDVDVVRVHYDDTLPRIALDTKLSGLRGVGVTTAMAKRVLSCKHRAWLYEREWRVLGPLRRLNYGDRRCVAGVIVGQRAPREVSDRIKGLCGNLRIRVSQMEVEGYRLNA